MKYIASFVILYFHQFIQYSN